MLLGMALWWMDVKTFRISWCLCIRSNSCYAGGFAL